MNRGLLLFLYLVPALLSAQTSLCKKREYTFFSCQLTNNKYLSFCATSENSDDLTYRYGLPKKIEKVYSSKRKDFGVTKKARGELTQADLNLQKEGNFVQGTGNAVNIAFIDTRSPFVFYFWINEILILPNEKPSDILQKGIVYTKILRDIYLETILAQEDIRTGQQALSTQCKQGVDFKNLFKLKTNAPFELKRYL